MKVLFAVSDEKISDAIIKQYQKEYREIISYKNVYYFNAILKELQKDKTYDRIVISEDLEPFANNNYDSIDKFIFEKLDSISDEALDSNGQDTSIILICTDRRTKASNILVKLFGIGLYNAIIGKDRSIEEVCALINRPRTKKEAKEYYKIDVDDVNYQAEDSSEVNELELQNILAHYKRLGKNTDRYTDSFNNIASQYNDAQLRIIINCLPIGVKAVLEAESPKYQELMAFSNNNSNTGKKKAKVEQRQPKVKQKEPESIKVDMLESNQRMDKPVVIPGVINTSKVRSVKKAANIEQDDEEDFRPIKNSKLNKKVKFAEIDDDDEDDEDEISQRKVSKPIQKTNKYEEEDDEEEIDPFEDLDDIEEIKEEKTEPVKKGRGRPKKVVETVQEEVKPKGKRGRPKKNAEPEEEVALPGFEDYDDDENEEEVLLPGMEDDDEDDEYIAKPAKKVIKSNKPKYDEDEEEDDDEEESTLPGMFDDDDDDEEDEYELPKKKPVKPTGKAIVEDDDEEEEESETMLPGMGFEDDEEENDEDDDEIFNKRPQIRNSNPVKAKGIAKKSYDYEDEEEYEEDDDEPSNQIESVKPRADYSMSNLNSVLTKDKKIVAFVGTTKNGTSFLVNNLASLFSSIGVKTALLDMTKNRNSYYIYTKNEENLRKIAFNSIEKLQNGFAEGIKAEKNLTVYTSLPNDNKDYSNAEEILSTLAQNYSLILIDCDFDTDATYFANCQEIYLVQSMDILTIQPLTAFLRELKTKGVLDEEKLKVVINKEIRVRSLTAKTIIGGMSFYNDPAMSFMTELFNKDKVKFCSIPFEDDVYSKYLETLVNCNISISKYSKNFQKKLKLLGEMVYPSLNKTYTPSSPDYSRSSFSKNMNNTLNQMKNRY